MNRRNFLQFLGVAAAGAALPSAFAGAKVARPPLWYSGPVLRVSLDEGAPAGDYIFTAWVKKSGESWGIMSTGFKLSGGEKVLEIPCERGLVYTRFQLESSANIASNFQATGAMK